MPVVCGEGAVGDTDQAYASAVTVTVAVATVTVTIASRYMTDRHLRSAAPAARDRLLEEYRLAGEAEKLPLPTGFFRAAGG